MTKNTKPKAIEYVIYCRMSSKEQQKKQIQSIPDQIKLCVDYADKNNLVIHKKPTKVRYEDNDEIKKQDLYDKKYKVTTYKDNRKYYIIKEDGSAKEPSKKERPKRNKLIKLVEKGDIKGIISYSPDRQARNMVDGGEIIHLAHREMVDLKYANFSFENNAGGRMMLGVWFVFSKQYSDKLSEDVSRGLKSKVEMGHAMGIPKYGYLINNEGFHEAHPINFPLIKKAFHMKIYDNKSDEKIASWLNKNGFTRFEKSGKELDKVSGSVLNKIRDDAFYYGRYVYGQNEANLNIVSEYYEPVITEDEYIAIIERETENSIRLGRRKKDKDLTYPTPGGFVIVPDGSHLSPYVTKMNIRKGILEKERAIQGNSDLTLEDIFKYQWLRYECKSKSSKYKGLSINYDVIDKKIISTLEDIRVSDTIYGAYVEEMKKRIKKQDTERYTQIRLIELQIGSITKRRDEYDQSSIGLKTDSQKEIYNNKMDEYNEKIDYLESRRKNLESERRKKVEEYGIFLEILQNAGKNYKNQPFVRKQKIISFFFSNLIVNKGKKLRLVPKPGLEILFDRSLSSGAEYEIRTRDLNLGKVAL